MKLYSLCRSSASHQTNQVLGILGINYYQSQKVVLLLPWILLLALQLQGIWSMEFKTHIFFFCVLKFSIEVPRTLARFWSYAGHTKRGVCMTHSPHCATDGKDSARVLTLSLQHWDKQFLHAKDIFWVGSLPLRFTPKDSFWTLPSSNWKHRSKKSGLKQQHSNSGRHSVTRLY